jgi:8-amino-7-oxononanoate synthase
MTDDAHGFAVVDMENPADVQMGTLSKAVGGYGGYVAGPQALIDLLTSRARSFVYTTGLPPAVLGAAIAALEIIETQPQLGVRTMLHARLFCEQAGLPEPHSAIVPLILGDADSAMRASQHLQQHGFLVTAIRPPTVPQGAARLRFTFSAAHRETDIVRLAAIVRDLVPAHRHTL